MEFIKSFIETSTREEWNVFLEGIRNDSNIGEQKKIELELVTSITGWYEEIK